MRDRLAAVLRGDVVRPAGSDRRSEHSDRGADSECDRADDARREGAVVFRRRQVRRGGAAGRSAAGDSAHVRGRRSPGHTRRCGDGISVRVGVGRYVESRAGRRDRTRDRQREPGQRHIHGIRPCVQHQPRSAGRALFRIPDRRSFPQREARRRTGARDTERRRFGLHQALRGERPRPESQLVHEQRRRADAARNLPARFRNSGRRGRPVGVHDGGQRTERRPVQRQQVAAQRCAEGRMGFQGTGAYRFLPLPFYRESGSGRTGYRYAVGRFRDDQIRKTVDGRRSPRRCAAVGARRDGAPHPLGEVENRYARSQGYEGGRCAQYAGESAGGPPGCRREYGAAEKRRRFAAARYRQDEEGRADRSQLRPAFLRAGTRRKFGRSGRVRDYAAQGSGSQTGRQGRLGLPAADRGFGIPADPERMLGRQGRTQRRYGRLPQTGQRRRAAGTYRAGRRFHLVQRIARPGKNRARIRACYRRR